MKQNSTLLPSCSHKGSIVLVSSTSGYFGGSAVTGYVASKHGVIGLLRSSQAVANKIGVRVNGVAPFFTPSTGVEFWFRHHIHNRIVQEVALPLHFIRDSKELVHAMRNVLESALRDSSSHHCSY